MTTDSAKHSKANVDVNEEQANPAAEDVAPQHSEDGKHAGHAGAGHAKPRAKSRRWVRVVLVVVGVILVLCVIAAAALGNFVNSGKDELLADNEAGLTRKNIYHNGKNYVLNENIVSIAVLGTDRLYGYVVSDEENGSADAILLLAYDTSNGKMTLINIPRNTIATFKVYGENGGEADMTTFISSAYAYGQSDAEGSEAVCGAISNLFGGLPVENYVTLLESCIGPLTEVIGGVTVTAIQDVPWVGVKAGETYTMKGEQALRYVQWRNIWESTSPADRAARQQTFAKEFMRQAVDAIKKNPAIIGDLYGILTDPEYMTTNLQLNELAYLVSSAALNGVNDLEMVTIPYDAEYNPVSLLTAYVPRQDELIDLLTSVYYTPAE